MWEGVRSWHVSSLFPRKVRGSISLDKFIDEAVFVASGAYDITHHNKLPVATS